MIKQSQEEKAAEKARAEWRVIYANLVNEQMGKTIRIKTLGSGSRSMRPPGCHAIDGGGCP